MRTIKIGRDSSCQIILNHEMISRHHAILRVYPTGKMELVSMGTNGTKLNGVLLRPNVVYRVKRSDMISFADRFQLDWNLVYNPRKKFYIIAISVLAILILLGLALMGKAVYSYLNPSYDDNEPGAVSTDVTQGFVDGTPTKAEVDNTPANPNSFSKKDFFPEPTKESKKSKLKENNEKSKEGSDSIKKNQSAELEDSVSIREKVII